MSWFGCQRFAFRQARSSDAWPSVKSAGSIADSVGCGNARSQALSIAV